VLIANSEVLIGGGAASAASTWRPRFNPSGGPMITCLVDYQIDRSREAQFERFCRLWLELTPKFGGVHHGYFLPSDGPSDRAFALFSFESFADYEQFRIKAAKDEEVMAANRIRDTEAGVIRWDRSFYRPLFR
jgi:hypothetical protein